MGHDNGSEGEEIKSPVRDINTSGEAMAEIDNEQNGGNVPLSLQSHCNAAGENELIVKEFTSPHSHHEQRGVAAVLLQQQ